MSANPDRLLLLADHIKLSLMERNRAISLNLESNTSDSHILRNLDTLNQGIEEIEKEQTRIEEHGEVYDSPYEMLPRLLGQFVCN